MKAEKIVTVFGSSRVQKNGKSYKEAYQLGKLLAEAGFVVCNGGYRGSMEASAMGAKEAGGRTVGITTEAFKGASPNPWIDIESHAESYVQRLLILTSVADAFIVLRGGIGTLGEMALVWSLADVGESQKPVILMGDTWQKVIDDISKNLMVRDRDIEVLNMVETPEEAVEFLNAFWSDK